MKIVAKPVKTIVVFERDGSFPVPYKFKIEDEEGSVVAVKVKYIHSTYKSRIAGVESIFYECQSVICGAEKRYELKYIPARNQWQLYKI